MSKSNRFAKSKILAGIVAASAVLPASAQQLEEIIVTAQQRAQSLQDVPVSVSAVSAEKMSDVGVVDLEGLSSYVPNFSINETGISTTITVRGISSGVNSAFEQSVGMYNDGVFYGRDQLARVPLFDLERVEVLRGPQGILFGKNSIAGAVSQISAKPSDELEGNVTVLYEPDAKERDVRFVVSGPLSDSVRGRLAILDREQDGYFENTTLGRDEQIEDESFIRASLEWDVSDNFTANFKVSQAKFDIEGRNIEVYNSITDGNPGSVDHLTVLNSIQSNVGGGVVGGTLNRVRDNNGDNSFNEVNNATINLEWALDGITITSITSNVDYEFTEVCDCDFTGAVVFDADRIENYDQFSQELRFTSDLGGTVDYIGGLFYQTSELEYVDKINLPTNSILPIAINQLSPAAAGVAALAPGAFTQRDYALDTDVFAVFLQATWNILTPCV